MKLGEEPKEKSPITTNPMKKIGAKNRRTRKDTTVIESPDWLPKGWVTELRTRMSGQSVGATDKYYFEPVTNRRFSSKKQVLKFLESGIFRGYQCKEDDSGRNTSAKDINNPMLGAAGTGNAPKNISASESTSGINTNRRPSKVLWVLNNSGESWVPFASGEETDGSNSKAGESVPHGNRVDECGKEQSKIGVSENQNSSRGPTIESFQPEIDLNKPMEGKPTILSFGDSWQDPCFEFAVKTLTGAIPIFDDNLALQGAFKQHFSPQTKASDNNYMEHPPPTEQKASSSGKNFDGSKDNQNIFSVLDGLADRERLSEYGYTTKVNNLMRHQAKHLLEPLGRKICKQALAFSMKSGHASPFFEKQAKAFQIDSGYSEQNSLSN